MLEKDRKKRISLLELKKMSELSYMNWAALEAQKIKAPFSVNIEQKCGKMPIVYELKLNELNDYKAKKEEENIKRTFSV